MAYVSLGFFWLTFYYPDEWESSPATSLLLVLTVLHRYWQFCKPAVATLSTIIKQIQFENEGEQYSNRIQYISTGIVFPLFYHIQRRRPNLSPRINNSFVSLYRFSFILLHWMHTSLLVHRWSVVVFLKFTVGNVNTNPIVGSSWVQTGIN